jgi:hypothetical protein
MARSRGLGDVYKRQGSGCNRYQNVQRLTIVVGLSEYNA